MVEHSANLLRCSFCGSRVSTSNARYLFALPSIRVYGMVATAGHAATACILMGLEVLQGPRGNSFSWHATLAYPFRIVICWIDPPKVLLGLLDASTGIHKTQALTFAYPFRGVPNDLLDRAPSGPVEASQFRVSPQGVDARGCCCRFRLQTSEFEVLCLEGCC